MKKLCFIILTVLSFQGWTQSLSPDDTTHVHTLRGTYYSDRFVGRKTSNGEIFDQKKFTAAHKSLPFGTLVLVTNIKTRQQVIVRINDRCPRTGVIDLSRRAAKKIGIGSQIVEVQILPERYYTYWERQEEWDEVMHKGDFLTQVRSQEKEGKKPIPQKTETKREEPPEQESESQPEEDVAPVPLFNIQLGQYPSRNTAQKTVSQLPIHYHDNVVYTTQISNSLVIATLNLHLPKNKAEHTLSELQSMFPEAKLIREK